MLKHKYTVYSLIVAIALSILSLYAYLTSGTLFSSWFTVTNNAEGSGINIGSSFSFLFLVGSLIAWINFVTIYLKYRKD